MYDSPMPTPRATRKTVGPRRWMAGGASGRGRIGMGASRPACQTRWPGRGTCRRWAGRG